MGTKEKRIMMIDFNLEQSYYLKIDAEVSEHILNLASALQDTEVGSERWERGYQGLKACNDMLNYQSMIIAKYEYLMRLLRRADMEVEKLTRKVEELQQTIEQINEFNDE